MGVSERVRSSSDCQYGFRKARSTINAVPVVSDTALTAIECGHWRIGYKKYCAIMILYVRIVLNSANGNCIIRKHLFTDTIT